MSVHPLSGNVQRQKKGKIIALLMVKGRIKERTLLFKQKIIDDEFCSFGCQEVESVEHFALDYTKQILIKLGIQ
jgi:hypothetical protein